MNDSPEKSSPGRGLHFDGSRQGEVVVDSPGRLFFPGLSRDNRFLPGSLDGSVAADFGLHFRHPFRQLLVLVDQLFHLASKFDQILIGGGNRSSPCQHKPGGSYENHHFFGTETHFLLLVLLVLFETSNVSGNASPSGAVHLFLGGAVLPCPSIIVYKQLLGSPLCTIRLPT